MAKKIIMPMSYPALLYKHLDRMSELLEKGMEAGQYHTTLLTSYYLGTLHFESLLSIHLDKEYYTKREEYMKKFPDFSQTWEGDIGRSVAFLQAVSKWFQLLLLKANETGMLSFSPKTYDDSVPEEELTGGK